MKVTTAYQQLMFVSAIVEVSAPVASSGTAFIYNAGRNGQNIPVLVTNKHVVRGAQRGGIRLIGGSKGSPDLGNPIEIIYDGFEQMWVGHPDDAVDVAAMFIGPTLNQLAAAGREAFFRQVDPQMAPSEEVLGDLDAVEPITFVGYPNGLFDQAHHTPIIRQGHTATPLQLDWNGSPTFLVDASVFPGSSGSPVFIVQQGSWREGNTTVMAGGTRVFFVGIIAAVMIQADTGQVVPVAGNPLVQLRQMLDLGIVYNWRAVEEAVDTLAASKGVDRRATTVDADQADTPDPRSVGGAETADGA